MSAFLMARFLGLYLTLSGIGFLAAPLHSARFFKQTQSDPILNYFLGQLALIFGALVLAFFPHLIWGWEVLIPLVGLSSLAEGIVRTMFPSLIQSLVDKTTGGEGLRWIGTVFILIGGFLLFKGFLS